VLGQLTSGDPVLLTKELIKTTASHFGLETSGHPAAGQALFAPTNPNEAMACDWMASAAPGQVMQYHEGHLLVDRSETLSSLSKADRNRLHALARRMWIGCELGLVNLFSQRLGDCRYRYMAIRAATPLAPPQVRDRLRQRADSTPRTSH
jgi:hypothetical protein